MRRLARDTDRLTAAVRAGDLDAARKLWLPAHLDYSQLGVAYDTFGQFNDRINQVPFGLVGGVDDPAFRGFLRLEYGLWHGQSKAELTPVAGALAAPCTASSRSSRTDDPAGGACRCARTRSSRTRSSSS